MSPPVSESDARLLRAFERTFRRHAGPDARIDVAELQRALGLRSEYLAERVFAAFDRDGNGSIDREEFLNGVRRLIFGTGREKLEFAFRVHDHDGDGSLDRREVLRMIAISMAEGNVTRGTQPPELLASALFAAADHDGDGRISFDEFAAAVRARPELLERMTRSEAVWILPNEDLVARLDSGEPVQRRRWSGDLGFLPTAFALAWAAANIAIFLITLGRAAAGATTDPFMQVGRASGACIQFDGALILVPMMRRLLTRLRPTWLGRVLPIDDAVGFHRLVGHALFGLSLVHAGAFVAAYAGGHAGSPVTRLFFGTARGLSGLSLLVVFAVIWTFALEPIRRSRRFELFYFTHLLYVAWLVIAVIHGPSLLVLAGVPIAGFLVEQVLRRRRRRPPSAVVSNQALRSGVTRLEITRPDGFVFGPGDYAFLRIPAIARGEWHPFTISSAPERSALTFHVRALGNWSSALRQRAERGDDDGTLVAHVDGPYGSPSGRIFESKYAVLIGAGIGVTPFASVLESVVLRGNGPPGPASRLEKVHFFWLNRDQFSFEWFAALLAELETEDRRGLLDIHLCMTDGREGVTALGLELARDAMKKAGRSDLITGLRTRTHLGPPDWDGLLGTVARQHAEPVDVFFCGPPGLGAKLRPICTRLGMRFREERF